MRRGPRGSRPWRPTSGTPTRRHRAITRRAADGLINLRGIKMYPVQLEEAVRAVPGVGDEHEIVLSTDAAGLDVMTVRVDHAERDRGRAVAYEIRTRCEVRVEGEALARGHAAENGARPSACATWAAP